MIRDKIKIKFFEYGTLLSLLIQSKDMTSYTEQTFDIPELKGISKRSIEEHLKLYAGYVKHSNLINQKIEEYRSDMDKNAYVIGELQRRFGFEFNGMRNHEYYFAAFVGGAKSLPENSSLKAMLCMMVNTCS